ncbi:hypothetical protein [Halapricum desulfuricans]|uniref:Uncharacterized protein n=1 Tax=Halapricum desulfuricans TaxID=2841257 RepID=A0A897N1Z4_9EURY|nr:hypothetical protein [Halapricum desulfuricans]QSG05109.1 Uncharacterized protein HSR121_0755 [Halapricum desulfuricans]
MSVDDRIDRALSASRVRQGLDRLASGSGVVAGLTALVRDGATTLPRVARSWLAGSTLRRFGGRVSRRLSSTVSGSRTLSGLSAVERWVRSSWLYRWLTAEPEPEVIVIDLRETVTVRPFLIAIDAAIGLFVGGRRTSTAWRSLERARERFADAPVRYASLSGLFALLGVTAASVAGGTLSAGGVWLRLGSAVALLAGARVDRPWSELRASRPVQLVIAALEPPEPPGEQVSRERGIGESDDSEGRPAERSRGDETSGTSPSSDDTSDS